MTDSELAALVTAIVTVGLVTADKTYVVQTDWHSPTREERFERLVEHAAEIAKLIIERGYP